MICYPRYSVGSLMATPFILLQLLSLLHESISLFTHLHSLRVCEICNHHTAINYPPPPLAT